MSHRKRNTIIALVIISVSVLIYVLIMDRSPVLTAIEVTSTDLPAEFNGFKIAHISDFHNAELDESNKKLCNMLSEAKPEIIVITGDLIDSRRTDVDVAAEFIKNITEIAPCYYVTGNHESRVDDNYAELEKVLTSNNVVILRNQSTTIERNGSTIEILGIDDPDFTPEEENKTYREIISDEINKAFTSNDHYKILLSHRPETFEVYVQYGIDLVFSGHAHGGQIRIPFIGGIIAPDQGLFPKYDSGLFTEDNTNMIVSRGIGNSIFPLRVNNRPEIILATLKTTN